MNNITLKYESELINYKYCDSDNINDIPKGSHIKYFSKKSLLRKNGFLRNIKDNSILELININKKIKWYIYIDQNYIFYKNPNSNSLKETLKNLVNNNFSIKKIM